MNLDLKEITFIIVSYNSKKVIFDCINSLPKFSKIIVIENSHDHELKKEIELKYDNIEVLLSENIGMGASNNIGIKKSNTKYALVLNPDVVFKEKTFLNLIEGIKKIEDFSIVAPINADRNFPNYEVKKNHINKNKDIIDVESVDGFCMLLNKSKFNENEYFDENFFLYLENTDLCLRQKKRNEKIYVIKNSEIEHMGSYSTKIDKTKNQEYVRNWHWMWSKFYFNKKHFGFTVAFLKILKNFSSALIKYLFYLILFKSHKKMIYKMRLLGLYNSIIGKNSFLRP